MAMELLAARSQPRTVASKKFASMSALPLWTVAGITLVPAEAGTAMSIAAMRVVGRRLAMVPTLPSLLVGGKPVRFYTRSSIQPLYPSMTDHMRNHISMAISTLSSLDLLSTRTDGLV